MKPVLYVIILYVTNMYVLAIPHVIHLVVSSYDPLLIDCDYCS